MTVTIPRFELENAGAGPDPFTLASALEDTATNAVVLLLQRDFYCIRCRQQVQAVAARYDEFEAAAGLVVSILPEPIDRVRTWQESYDLPFPLLADPSKGVVDELDQPTRFGILGNLTDFVGRMPEALVVDVRGTEPQVTFSHRGSTPGDRPSIDELLHEVTELTTAKQQ